MGQSCGRAAQAYWYLIALLLPLLLINKPTKNYIFGTMRVLIIIAMMLTFGTTAVLSAVLSGAERRHPTGWGWQLPERREERAFYTEHSSKST